MKILSIGFDEEAFPDRVTVELSIEEVAFITKFTGSQTGITANQIMPRGAEPSHELYEGFTGYVFNNYWEEGVAEYLRGRK